MAANREGSYCLYQGPVVSRGQAYGGPVNLRTRQGFAVIAFASKELAEYFRSVFKQNAEAIPLSSLGAAAHPIKPEPGLPRPRKLITFPTKGVLSAWAEDREGFDTAPYVSELPPLEEQWPLP